MSTHHLVENREEAIRHAQREFEEYKRSTRFMVGFWVDGGLVTCSICAVFGYIALVELGWLDPRWRLPLTGAFILINIVSLVRFLGARRLRRRVEHLEDMSRPRLDGRSDPKIVRLRDSKDPEKG